VDRALDLVDVDEDAISDLADRLPSIEHLDGVAMMPDGLALIHDVDAFLSEAELESLDAAITAATTSVLAV
jgi:chemotaxis signal transduction protein